MATCKECLHYRVCAGSGLILDPLHGGVICEDYKHKEDVVEVVRCKDCIYHNVPPCPMRLSLNWTNDNDFCSYGERKDTNA